MGAAAGVNVTTYHNDNARDGWNSSETTLTPQNVNFNAFGKLRELAADGKVDAQPLYVSGLSISGQTHNVLIVVTENASASLSMRIRVRNCGRSRLWTPTRRPVTIMAAARLRRKLASPTPR